MRPLSVFCLIILTVGLAVAGSVKHSPTAVLHLEKDLPMFMNYQGYLTDTVGTPITANAIMVFEIYGDSVAGAVLWSHSGNVRIEQGVFNVKLPMAAGDTSLFMGGARRWIELTVNAHKLHPRTEITTMAYGFRAVYADNSDMLDGMHSNEFIHNTSQTQPSSDFHIDGRGVAESQFRAYGSGLNNSAAVWGAVSGNNTGIYGSSQTSNGVYGTSQTGTGVFGYSAADDRFGLRGFNSHAVGTGVIAAGCADTSFYLEGGSGGAFTARHIGLFAYAHDTTGTGIATMGNRITDTVYTLPQGSGGAFNGTTIGVYGLARDSLNPDLAGGYFEAWPHAGTTYAWVAARFGGTVYKIIGQGQVSTVMATREGNRVLFAPESPEPFFEDLGFGQLESGHCRVDLDPLFTDCITVDAGHPLKVFVTLNDDCNGVYVQTDSRGFDVYELRSGRSDAQFTWRVVAGRRDGIDLRLPAAPEPPHGIGTAVGRAATPAGPTR